MCIRDSVWGNGRDAARDERIAMAWSTFDELEKKEGRASTKAAIENTLIRTTFTERHIESWPVWAGTWPHGMAMLMAGIAYDLEAQLESSSTTNESDTATGAKDKFFQTLSNFTDPFVDPSEAKSDLSADDFHYSVTAWEGSLCRPIISDEREFDYRNLEDLEHVIEGVIDQNGLFHGTVKAFGKLLDEMCIRDRTYTGGSTHASRGQQ